MHNPLHHLPLLCCPECHRRELVLEEKNMICKDCSTNFPIVRGRPVVIRFDNALFPVSDYINSELPVFKSKHWNLGGIDLASLIPSPSVNLSQIRVLKKLCDALNDKHKPIVLVIGSGSQRHFIRSLFFDHIAITFIDVSILADVDIYCDAHELPFFKDTFDAVIITAVVEHVLYPEKVAIEITRVIKNGGLLYSEVPFMQQVHEGAYDFTRFTLSGHRRLFNRFCEIESGMVAGPATAFLWSIENLILSFCTHVWLRKVTKLVVRVLFFYIKYIDYLLINRQEAMDAASSTYFYGYKTLNIVPDDEIINTYVGAKHL